MTDSIENDNIEEEFEVDLKESSIDLQERLKWFAYYLVENFELNLDICLHLLEDRNLPNKPNSIHITAISTLASASIGKPIGAAVKQGEIFILNKIAKGNSRKVADLVYFYSDYKDKIRQTLIEAAVDVFYCFEVQFKKLTCNGGPKRAMQKLAQDASQRIFNYFLENEPNKNVTKNDFSQGVVLGKPNRNKFGLTQGRTIKDETVFWKTSKLYRKVGIYIVEDNIFLKTKNTNTDKYGHRRVFPWENLDDIKENWEKDHEFPELKYDLEITQELLLSIKHYIMNNNIDERAKLEREYFHNETVEDREKKQIEIMSALDQNFEELLNDLEVQYSIATQNHKEQKELIKDIQEKQNQEISNQCEIQTKLVEIHKDVKQTVDGQLVLMESHKTIQNELSVIQKSQKDVEKQTVSINMEQVRELVDKTTQEKLNNVTVHPEIKKVEQAITNIKEKLRKNDPSRSIKKEVNKRLKKLKL